MKKNIVLLFIIICLGVLLYSIYNILIWKKITKNIKNIENNEEIIRNNNLDDLEELRKKSGCSWLFSSEWNKYQLCLFKKAKTIIIL